MQGTKNCIYNDAVLTTGTYEGNHLNAVGGHTIYTAASHALSHLTIGNNYDNGSHDFVSDSNGLVHVFLEASEDQNGKLVSAGAFETGVGQLANRATLTVSALNRATDLTGSQDSSGLLHVRDNTLGGSAVFVIDPKRGAQLLGASGVTGLAPSGICYSSGNWHISLTSGAVPRTITWSIVQ